MARTECELQSEAKPIMANCDLRHFFVWPRREINFSLPVVRKHVFLNRVVAKKNALSDCWQEKITGFYKTKKTKNFTYLPLPLGNLPLYQRLFFFDFFCFE